MSPQNNAGYVRITSSDPTATPDINMNYYAVGGDIDVGAIMDTVAWVRRGFAALPAPYGPILETIEPPCPSGYDPKTGICSVPEEDAQWIREQTFGHHAVGTCKMGTEDDVLAVVDAKFRGVFNSPQLLQLSGIGNATHLKSLGIDVVRDLPGVGLNLRDNQELPVAGHSPVNITLTQDDPLWPSCTRGAPGDPCLELWYEGKGPYRGPPGNSECTFLRTDHSPNGKRDVLTFG